MNKVLMGTFISLLSLVIMGGLGWLIYNDIKGDKTTTDKPQQEQEVDYKDKYTKLLEDYTSLVKSNSDLQNEFDKYKETSVSKAEYDAKVDDVEKFKVSRDFQVKRNKELEYSIANYKYQLNNNEVVVEYEYFNNADTTYEDFKNELGSCVTSIYVTYNEKTIYLGDEGFTSALKENGAILHIEFTNKLDKFVRFGICFNGQGVLYDGSATENGSSCFSFVVTEIGEELLGNNLGDIYVINLRYIA